ncbi:hypothetical protein OIU77_023485 [Salix suchowensis]|uniref:Uncharacterized protein n=1 Tax=Salix suchowensis TaxID=1278906 RepID=A0ABQ9C401_9ROSI|nr:hypothetical protein OIU77_023485 [Salix suchowensis]
MIDTPLSFNPSLPQLNLPSSSTTTTATTTMPSTASQSTSHPPNCLSHSGLSDVPANWKGIRETRPDFPASSCNKKLIGARAFNNGYITHKVRPNEESKESASPRDTEGHGTHTATSAAGL